MFSKRIIYFAGGMAVGVLALIAVFLFVPNRAEVNSNGVAQIKSLEAASTSSSTLISTHYAAPFDIGTYETFFSSAQTVGNVGEIKGAIVPHHLVAGYLPATLFNYLKQQKPSTILIVGPNHWLRGNNVISSALDWQTPYGILRADKDLVGALFRNSLASGNEEVMKEEHAIYGLVSFIKKALPDTKIIPIIIKYQTPTSTLDNLVENLKIRLPADAFVLASVDFSHYMTSPVANFHDELSQAVIKNFDYNRLDILDVDSPASLYVLLKLMENYQTQTVVKDFSDNSARLMGRPDLKQTTSYYSAWFSTCHPRESGDPVTVIPAKAGICDLTGQTPVSTGVTNVGVEKAASFLFFGDMMLDRNVKKQIDTNGAEYIFKTLAGEENRFFLGQDIVHANLEGPFANSRRATSKSIAFRFDPLLIPTLKKYRFNVFTVANNHTLDMGSAGLKESQANLKKAGISFYGDGYGISDAAMTIKEVGGMKIAFLGFNDTFYSLDNKKIVAQIKKSRASADFVVVNIHWGEEYKELSNTRQRTLAHAMIDEGADVIIGHHPHVIQEIEMYKDHPIFYSLGNFVFDQYFSTPTQQGLAVGLVCHCEERSNEAIPTQSEKCVSKSLSVYVFPLEGVKSSVRQMEFEKAFKTLYDIIGRSRLDGHEFKNFNLKLYE